MENEPTYSMLEERVNQLEHENKKLRSELQESEAKYGCLFDKGSEGLTLMKNRIFVDCNNAVLKLLNLKSKEEFLNLHPSELSPILQPDGRKSYDKAEEMMDVAEKNGINRFEWVHKGKHGEEFLVEVTLISTTVDDENIMYAFWRDITERNNSRIKIQQQYHEILTQNEEITSANEELRSVNEQLHKSNEKNYEFTKFLEQREKELKRITLEQKIILDNLGSIVTFTKERKIIWVNSPIMNVFGYAPQEIIGKDSNLIYPSEKDYLEFGTSAYPVLEKGETFFAEKQMRKKNGDLVWCSLVGNAINPVNLSDGVIWILDDITQRKKRDEELNVYQKHLESLVANRTADLVETNNKLKDEIIEKHETEKALSESQKKYKSIFENSPLGIFHYNNNAVITDCNKKFVEIIGSSQEALIGLDMLNQLKDKKVISEIVRSLKEGNGFFEDNYSSVTANKTTATRMLFKGIRDEKGEINGGVGIVEDITERKKAEKELLNEKRFSDTLIESLPGIFYLYKIEDQQAQLVRWNKNHESILGYSPDELKGRSAVSFFEEGSEQQKIANAIDEIFNKGITKVEAKLKHNKNNSLIPFQLIGKTFEDADDQYFLGVGVDIKERKEFEDKLLESRERYREIVEASRAIIWEFDWTINSFVHVSGNVEEITGFSKNEWLQEGFWVKQLHPDDKDYALLYCTSETGKGENHIFEYRLICKNGEVIWFRDFVHVISSDKKALRASGMMIDITEVKRYELEIIKHRNNLEELVKERTSALDQEIISRKEAENALKHSLLQLQSILTNLPVIIWAVDKEGFFTLSEGSELKKLGLKPGQVVGYNVFEMYKDNPIILEYNKRALNGEVCNYESEVMGITYKNIIIPNKNENGETVSTIGVGVNVTDLKQVEIELKKAKEEADAANIAKSEFLANMSHEIRTPMNAILGFSEILKEKLSDNEQHHEYIQGIYDGGRNLLRLIDDILDLSKVEAGRLEIQKEPVNPHNIIKEVKQIFKLKIQEKGLKLNINIDSDSPDIVMLDETRLRQVLFNLVGNAVKYTKAGEINLSMFDERINGNSKIKLTFEVSDTGIGIPADQQKIIFEPFRQRLGQKVRKYKGTGLGLAISKKLVEMMNGKITVNSVEGKGSTFTVTIPNVEISSIAHDYNEIEQLDDVPNIQFEKAKILYAEDILSNRQVVRAYLANYNLDLIEAENGEEAIALIKKVNVDLVLMDVEMPVMNGYEAANIIRGMDKYKNIPILVLTASAMKSDEEKILKYCNEYIKKPVSKSNLISYLMKYLPYKTIEEAGNKKVQHGNSTIFDLINSIKPLTNKTQMAELLGSVHPIYDDIKETYSMDETEEFSQRIIAFGEKHNHGIIKEYGVQLLSALAKFNFDEIECLVNLYPTIYKNLSNEKR